MIIWIEKRLVDILILKEHPQIRGYFKRKKPCPGLVKKRKKYNNLTFGKIIDKALEVYPDFSSYWHPLLEDLWIKRDAIAHGRISLAENYLFFHPKDENVSARTLQRKLKIIRRGIDVRITRSRSFKISFENDNYKKMTDKIEEFDNKCFPALCSDMGIDYRRIR